MKPIGEPLTDEEIEKRKKKFSEKHGSEKVKEGNVCPVCGSNSLMYAEGCMTCLSCGWSKCS
jgi:ribonucleoside-diphosphate reductase alpha chain